MFFFLLTSNEIRHVRQASKGSQFQESIHPRAMNEQLISLETSVKDGTLEHRKLFWICLILE